MDKVQSILARLNELHGDIDSLRAEVESNVRSLEQLAPQCEELKRVEARLQEANAAYREITAVLATAQADYARLEEHIKNRPF